jgi:diazepam-binding inhibitor (GABA receptor modulator, acyl-CoA-binding protein)
MITISDSSLTAPLFINLPMNFLKNSFNKLFGKTEEPKASVPAEEKPNQVNEEADIPADALVDFFEITSQFISESKQPAPDSLKLQLYSYYKQATIGDCNTPKPAIYELVAKTKWESWSNLKGMSAGTAMKHYIATAVQVDPLIPAKMASAFSKEEVTCEHHHHQHNMEREGAMMKMVKQ